MTTIACRDCKDGMTPYGACETCQGQGYRTVVTEEPTMELAKRTVGPSLAQSAEVYPRFKEPTTATRGNMAPPVDPGYYEPTMATTSAPRYEGPSRLDGNLKLAFDYVKVRSLVTGQVFGGKCQARDVEAGIATVDLGGLKITGPELYFLPAGS